MIYLYWYLGVGACALLSIVVSNRPTKKNESRSLNVILEAIHPEKEKSLVPNSKRHGRGDLARAAHRSLLAGHRFRKGQADHLGPTGDLRLPISLYSLLHAPNCWSN